MEDFWIPPSAIIKGGSQERVFSYSVNAQNVYYILDDGMNRKKIQYPWRIKEYISRQEAAERGRSECIDSYQMDAVRRIPVCRSRKGSEGSQAAVPELVE